MAAADTISSEKTILKKQRHKKTPEEKAQTPEDMLKLFFGSNNISETNQKIVLRYFQTMQKKSPKTIEYNRLIMQFLLTHVRTDLDKLIIDDIDDYQTAVNGWKRKDGSKIADTSKNQYIIGLKRFMRWYGKRYNDQYIKLADNLEKYKEKVEGKLPSDMLTTEEILKMIDVAHDPRDKAIIAVLAESGCRIGELLKCRVRDVERTSDGARVTFPEGKTGSRTVLISYMAQRLFTWLDNHPERNNPSAPLWATKNRRQGAYTALSHNTCYGMLQDVAKHAGIDKRVHPHLFRHSRATVLAQSLSDPIMRKIFGWSAGSNMPAVYTHISNADGERALKELYGLTDKKNHNGLAVGRCPRCSTVVPVESQYCGTCGMPLTKEAKSSVDETAAKILAIVTEHPEILATIAKQS